MPSYDSYSEHQFRRQLDAAQAQVKKILDTARAPQHPADVPHKYEDKYLLVEFATKAAIAAQANAFAAGAGAWAEHLPRLVDWARSRSVTLAFTAEERCAHDRTQERQVESATEHVSQSTMFGTSRSKTVTTITEHFWRFSAEWALAAYPGADPNQDRIVLLRGSGQHELKTTGMGAKADNPASSPKPESTSFGPVEVNATWLLTHLSEGGEARFHVDRDAASCATPRRNADTDAAITFFRQLDAWAARVRDYLRQRLFGAQAGHSVDLGIVGTDGLFAPVLGMFALEERPAALAIEPGAGPVVAAGGGGAAGGAASPALTVGDYDAFLAEQRRSLRAKLDELARALPGAGAGQLISAPAAGLAVCVAHAADAGGHHHGVVSAVEEMLRRQLVAAIGKELGPADFAEYMDFHNRRLFREQYRPRGFCYAVRRPDHYPEGTVSIEAGAAGSQDSQPVRTFCVHHRAAAPMSFPLSAAADLSFHGDRYLHACVLHQFSGQSSASLRLAARARQFSSYVLMVGKIASADSFEPSAALIVQNKDDLTLPLMLETIPTPKEFRDAIESLSPEQQRFAKAFRSMQLASTVFAVLVIQIKPQLERLLNLPDDSLTKEVELTQDLMELFIKYQFPSDLMAFGGDSAASAAAKVGAVKEHAGALKGMIDAARQRELKEQEELEKKRLMEREVPRRLSPGGRRRMESMELCDAMMIREMPMARAAAPASLCNAMAMPMGGGMGGMPPPPPAAAAPPPAPAAPGPPPPPQQQQSQQQQQQQATDPQQVRIEVRSGLSAGAAAAAAVDYTAIPTQLDQQFDALDADSAVRPTIIKPGKVWTKKSQAGLISDVKVSTLHESEQRKERDRAFDLLDALSRSGTLPVHAAELHVVLCATHCFDETLINTVVQRNVNPIEKAERSALIMSATIQNVPARELIEEEHVPRVEGHCPAVFAAPPSA